MTPEQKQKAIEVIQKDATLTHSYVKCEDACVIGGLLLAVGFSREKLEEINSSPIGIMTGNGVEQTILAEMRIVLQNEYGIDVDLAVKLQKVNDSCIELENRRSSLIQTLVSWSPLPQSQSI